MRARIAAVLTALIAATGFSLGPVHADSPYCDPYGDPQVYKDCLALQASQQKQAQNQAELNRVMGEEASTIQAIVDLENLIADLRVQIDHQEQLVAQTKAQVDALNTKIAALEAEIAREQAYIDQREQLLARRMRAIDMHGQIDYLEVIVTSTSFTDLLDRIVAMQQIVSSDHSLIEELRTAKAKVEGERNQLALQRDEMAALLAQQQQQEQDLANTQAQQQQALDYEHQHQADLEAYQQQLQAAQAAINAQVQQDQQNYAAAAAAAGGGSGQFSWPVRGYYTIAQGFGCTDYSAEPYDQSCPPEAHYFHAGIDIDQPCCQDIYAADTGVVSTGWDPYGYGNYIVMTHGNGWSTLYGHLSQFVAYNGETVGRGQLIGIEGSTGNSSGPHLHFGVMLNGSWVNPCAYLYPGC
jgi:murein DD-endopeptidase MepM/ murein hydrolase activator NlpD